MRLGRKNTVLLHAWKKTGQHWFMFVLANYHKILTENIQKPLDWLLVENFGRKAVGYTSKEWDGNRRAINRKDFREDYPPMLRSEMNWEGNLVYHESFDKVIYLCRNPFDVLLSYYYYSEKNLLRQLLIDEGDLEYAKDPLSIALDHDKLWIYIKERLPLYIRHLNEGYCQGDVVLKYEELMKDPTLFKEAFLLFYDEINEEAFKKALKFGGFEEVHKMNPHHARRGKVGQYKKEMTPQMIEYIKKICREQLKKKLMEELRIEAY